MKKLMFFTVLALLSPVFMVFWLIGTLAAICIAPLEAADQLIKLVGYEIKKAYKKL